MKILLLIEILSVEINQNKQILKIIIVYCQMQINILIYLIQIHRIILHPNK
jgi:hypothetical protein